jgi:hypothetical protein
MKKSTKNLISTYEELVELLDDELLSYEGDGDHFPLCRNFKGQKKILMGRLEKLKRGKKFSWLTRT